MRLHSKLTDWWQSNHITKDNKYPFNIYPLENSVSPSDVPSSKKNHVEESKRNIVKTTSIDIGTLEDPKILQIGAQCSYQEMENFIALFKKFSDVFSWSYKDICGFDLGITQHSISIK